MAAGLKEQIYSVLVVSASDNFNHALSSMLPGAHYDPVRYVSGISGAKRILNEREFDFVIINAPLPDDFGIGFAIDACSMNSTVVLLIVQASSLEDIRDKIVGQGIFTLSKPLSTQMFLLAMDWMTSARERLRKSEKKTLSIEEKMQEIKLVNRAKWLLITELKMTEAQAHQYIGKQAMDRCISRREVADEIIKTYS